MKKNVCLFFLALLLSCKSAKIFTSGSVKMSNTGVETIPVQFINNLPLINVTINEKDYVFIFDTGAPTVISTAIYNELELKPIKKGTVSDSKNNRNTQILTRVPQIKLGEATFHDIGCVVIDFSVPELSCYNIQGIIGANQMAKAIWKVNYSEEKISFTKDSTQFNLSDFNITFPFVKKPQQTPLLKSRLFGENTMLTFDTGYTGKIEISNFSETIMDTVKKIKNVAVEGVSTVGIYGGGNKEVNYRFVTDSVTIANTVFENVLMETNTSSLLGNTFLKNYEFVMDWTKSKIHLKAINTEKESFNTFGFSYRFIENKPIISIVVQDSLNPIKLGDEIISINNMNLENLTTVEACNYYINRIEKNLKEINIAVRRNDTILNFKLDKKTLLKE